MTRTRLTATALSIVVLGIVTSAQSGRKPVNWKELPEPFATPSVRNNSTVVAKPEGAALAASPGFVVQEFMDLAGTRPRFMMLGPGNEILISDTSPNGNGNVFVIKDGVRTPIIEKLDRPYGLALKGDQLYVAEPTSIKVYTYDARTMRVTTPGREIISLAGMGTGHNTRTLAFNRDGSKLYLSVGSGSNINLGEPEMRAAVHRFNPDGSGHETIATGLRNAVGMRFYPGTNDLWVTVHERDELGDDLAPDYATKIEPGGFYGWPIAYIGPHPEPRHKDIDMAKVRSTLYPDVILGGHVGPLDINFYTGTMFPEKYRGGMFVAMHGSWNRSERQGYKIAFIPFKNGMATAGPEDFVSGWMLAPDKKEVWGRPVGLLQMPDGSLLVSDDGGRKIWRISYQATAQTPAAPQAPAGPPRGSSGPPEHAKVTPINNLPNPYETVRNFGLLPDGRKWGSVSAINVDVDGKHIWVGDRCGTNSCAGSKVDPMVKLDPTGKVVASFGAGQILWPHGMDVDKQGNIWVVDARSATPAEVKQFPDAAGKGHTVLKFSPQGKLLMTLGTPGQAGDPPTKFTEPNDVLIAPDGSIFVGESHNAQFLDADGPGAIGRISKFSADGKFIRSFGSFGFGPSQFRGPHSLAMDSRGRLFVADRGNRRIQIFDQEGKHLDTWYQFSRISGLVITRDDTLYAIDSESDDNYNPGWRKGLRVGSARTGEVWYFVPEHVSRQASGMGGYGSMGEGVTVDGQGNVYAGEVGPVQGVTKFVPRLRR